MKKVAFHTLGCKVNYYDECWIRENLPAGFEEVKFTEKADFYIINSCAVTKKAQMESRRYAHQAKRRNPEARVIYTGCGAEIADEDLIEKGWADFVIGTSMKEKVIDAVKGAITPGIYRANSRKMKEVKCFGTTSFTTTRGFLKIQEGCDLMCTYCIVPYTRGKSRSVPVKIVIGELEKLFRMGFKEVVITGIHLGLYGKDTGESLEELLKEIARREDFTRIRLTSLDPHEVSDEMLKIIADSRNIMPHFHLSFQSGCDILLKRMGRRYTVKDLENVVNKIRRLFDNPSIGVDVIVGFPGETDEMFKKTKELLEKLEINYIHPFTYSDRPGTPSTKFPGRVDPVVKHERIREMKLLDSKLREKWAEKNLNRQLNVLTEEIKEGYWFGYGENYLPVLIHPDDRVEANNIYRVKVIQRRGKYGIGKVIRT